MARLPGKYGPVFMQLAVDQTVGAAVVNSGFLISLWLLQGLVNGTLFPLRSVGTRLGVGGQGWWRLQVLF